MVKSSEKDEDLLKVFAQSLETSEEIMFEFEIVPELSELKTSKNLWIIIIKKKKDFILETKEIEDYRK